MTKKLALITGVLCLAAIVAAVSCTPKTEPATPADFYKDKTIDFVVPHEAGNVLDIAARMIVPYLSGDTGANVIVNNMAGASGLEGINYVYRSEPDGLTLGFTTPAKFVPNKVLNEPAAEYELEQFSYIMSIGCRLYYFMVSPDGPYQSAADLQAGTNLKIGGGSPSGPISLGGLSAIKLLGLDAKVVTGIGGEADRALATKRGEIVGYFQSISAAKSGLDAGMIKPLFVLATARDSLMPDVPAIAELVDLSDEDLALAKLWETALVGSNMIFSTPGIPADRLAFLRDLAENWVQDEAFRQEMSTVMGYELQVYVTGEEVAESMREMASSLDDFQAIFAELIEKYRA